MHRYPSCRDHYRTRCNRRALTEPYEYLNYGNHLVSGGIKKTYGVGSHFRHGRDMRLCGKITGQPYCPREACHRYLTYQGCNIRVRKTNANFEWKQSIKPLSL
jgi:hypothetical protein